MTHHAYYIEGDLALFEEYKKEIPHFLAQKYERFGVDDSRELTERASLKVFGDTALFLIGASSLTSEAQQALLKLFEEPQQGIIFVFIVPHGTLLPTLRSRMLSYPKTWTLNVQVLPEASKFLKSSNKERSAQIAALLKDEDDVKERVRGFLGALELELAKKIDNKKVREGLEDIAKVRSYVGDRSPALKMLLEHLAISLPQI